MLLGMGRLDTNRRFAECAQCGHAPVAHLGGDCTVCSCSGYVAHIVNDGPPPRGTKPKPKPKPPSPPTPPVTPNPSAEALIAWVDFNLSPREIDRFLNQIAKESGDIYPPGMSLHKYLRPMILRLLSPAEAEGWLGELRRTQQEGQPDDERPPVVPLRTTDPPTCVTCGKMVSERVHRYCLDRPEKFGSLVYCFTHQRQGTATDGEQGDVDVPPSKDVRLSG